MSRIQISIAFGAIASLILLICPAVGGEASQNEMHDSERVAKWIGQCAVRLAKEPATRFPRVEILRSESEWRIRVDCGERRTPAHEIHEQRIADAHNDVSDTHGFSITVRRAFSPSPSLSSAVLAGRGTRPRPEKSYQPVAEQFSKARPEPAGRLWKPREWRDLDDGSMAICLSVVSKITGDFFIVHAQRSKSVTSGDAKVVDALLQEFADSFSIPTAEGGAGQPATRSESK